MADPATSDLANVLRSVVETHGAGIHTEPRRLEALLRDLGEDAADREILWVTVAARHRVAADLLAAGWPAPPVLTSKLTARLEELGFTHEAAARGVELWVTALAPAGADRQIDTRSQPRSASVREEILAYGPVLGATACRRLAEALGEGEDWRYLGRCRVPRSARRDAVLMLTTLRVVWLHASDHDQPVHACPWTQVSDVTWAETPSATLELQAGDRTLRFTDLEPGSAAAVGRLAEEGRARSPARAAGRRSG